MLNGMFIEWLCHADILCEMSIRKGLVIQKPGFELLQTLYGIGDTCQIGAAVKKRNPIVRFTVSSHGRSAIAGWWSVRHGFDSILV